MVKGLVFGLNSNALLASYDPNSYSLKTAHGLPIEGLTLSSVTLPRSGMMQNGNVFQLVPLDFPIKETEYGLLPTPCATEWKDCAKPLTLSKCDKGGRVARRICRKCSQIHSLQESVSLNPSFAEWMMGIMPGWTDLDVLETDKFHIAPTL